jgi:hypothetical protein
MRDHIADQPACAGAGTLPGVRREGVQVVLKTFRLRLDAVDTVCKGVQVSLPLNALFPGGGLTPAVSRR